MGTPSGGFQTCHCGVQHMAIKYFLGVMSCLWWGQPSGPKQLSGLPTPLQRPCIQPSKYSGRVQ